MKTRRLLKETVTAADWGVEVSWERPDGQVAREAQLMWRDEDKSRLAVIPTEVLEMAAALLREAREDAGLFVQVCRDHGYYREGVGKHGMTCPKCAPDEVKLAEVKL